MQERRAEDVRQAARVARPDAVLDAELVVIRPVRDLHYPDDRDESDHDEQCHARLGEHGRGVTRADLPRASRLALSAALRTDCHNAFPGRSRMNAMMAS